MGLEDEGMPLTIQDFDLCFLISGIYNNSKIGVLESWCLLS
jgi:hypothetical protein